jgi:hypothetical protein
VGVYSADSPEPYDGLTRDDSKASKEAKSFVPGRQNKLTQDGSKASKEAKSFVPERQNKFLPVNAEKQQKS